MKKLLAIVFVVSLFFLSAVPVLACDCDTAAAILAGVPDRLHRPWQGNPQPSDEKSKNYENGPKQEVQPMNINRDTQPKGEIRR